MTKGSGLIAILPGGRIISPIINYFPGGKKVVQFIYERFSRLHDRGSDTKLMTDDRIDELHDHIRYLHEYIHGGQILIVLAGFAACDLCRPPNVTA
ncbi:MAG: hypothetical protein WA364_24815 [Candidatus Nitrosopolaris sp.]